MSKKKRGVCVHCGEVRALTRDHVPPKNFFGKAPKGNLITVPCCHECNEMASKDQEYFYKAIVLRHDVSENPLMADTYAASIRSFQNPHQVGFTRSFLAGAHEREIFTKAGIYLGRWGVYDVAHERLDRAVSHVIKGLFWHHFGRPLRRDYVTYVYCETGIPAESQAEAAALHFAKQVANTTRHYVVNPSIFSYWYRNIEEDQDATGWLLTFCERVAFVGVTLPPEAVATR